MLIYITQKLKFHLTNHSKKLVKAVNYSIFNNKNAQYLKIFNKICYCYIFSK